MKKVKQKLTEILRQPQEDMAAHYRRVHEMIDFVESYFNVNIGDVSDHDVGSLTLNELRNLLEPKIEHYSKYVATDKIGVFREREELEEWLIEGGKSRGAGGQ